jgi:hypothetical protein
MKLTAIGTASADGSPRATGLEKAIPDQHATVTAELTLPDNVNESKVMALQFVLQREANRAAQVAAVDQRDQIVAREERARLRTVPADRPQIILGAGGKTPGHVAVVKGEWTINPGSKTAKTLRAAKGE